LLPSPPERSREARSKKESTKKSIFLVYPFFILPLPNEGDNVPQGSILA
jgi:hypothetical protein